MQDSAEPPHDYSDSSYAPIEFPSGRLAVMTDQEIYSAADVFGIARALPLNYVTRPSVDDELVEALSRNKHLVIYGSSKQGKTSVRKYSLQEDDYMVVTCNNQWDLGQLHSSILKQAGYTIVQSTTRSVSGHHKIKATASFTAKVPFLSGSGAMEGEKQEGEEGSITENPLELDPFDVNDIIQALVEIGFNRWIVLEDFHYLPEDTQKDFAVALKAFHENSQFTFIIVGVWLQENRLIQFNGDLSGRVSTINADVWQPEELAKAISLGEELLGIEFDASFKATLLKECGGSISIVQEACLLACQNAGIHSGTPEDIDPVPVAVPNAHELVARVVNQQSARFNDFLTNFAAGFGETELEMYRWLLVPVVTADPNTLDGGITYRSIRRSLNAIHPRGDKLNAGNVTQALKSAASLQVRHGVKPLVLDYDQSLKKLNVVDRSFTIWLSQQDEEDLMDSIELPVELARILRESSQDDLG